MVFNNAAVVLQQQNQTPSMNAGPGHSIAGTGGAVEFPAVEGSVQLDDPGVRLDGNLRMGDHTLAVQRPDVDQHERHGIHPHGAAVVHRR